MRIAQVAPLWESVPPKLYGGTERVVGILTEELVRMGHDVTLFASGDSRTRASLVPFRTRAIRLDSSVVDPWAPHVQMLETVAKRATEFDVVHFHVDYLHFSTMRRLGTPWVTTLHGRQDLPELAPLYDEFRDVPLVSITDAQRTPIPHARWVSTVYHGLPAEAYAWNDEPGEYLAFVGRMDPEKNPAEAIEIARRSGLPLRMAGKLEPQWHDYFERHVQPAIDAGDAVYLGEVEEAEKQALMRNAQAVLFPIRWPEPFGLVMVEAMAAGTPVIAYPYGSVPEVVEPGLTGFVAANPEEAAEAVHRTRDLDRGRVRERFEERFSARRMAQDYLKVYERLIKEAAHVVHAPALPGKAPRALPLAGSGGPAP